MIILLEIIDNFRYFTIILYYFIDNFMNFKNINAIINNFVGFYIFVIYLKGYEWNLY